MSDDQDNEPSIEEILDSIRQIISEDEEEEDVASDAVDVPDMDSAQEPPADTEIEAEKVEAPEPAPEIALEPLEEPETSTETQDLAEPALDDISFEEVAIDEDEDDILELTDIVPEDDPKDDSTPEDEPEIAFDPAPAIEDEPITPPAPQPETTAPEPLESLLSGTAETAALGAFSHLAKKAAVDRSGLVSVEDIVREEIRPILRNWIDDHLPKMLERLLQEELDKIAKRAMDD